MAVDPGLFMSEVDDCYRMQRDAVRRSLGLEGVTFCFLGEFIARKGIKEYLEALRRLRSISSRPFSALFVGDGPERNAMESWSKANRIPLVITGFRQQAELPRFYAAADVFALPSLEDNWALVTLEAAFAGLPQIFSRFNGATADLMAAGAPGIVVNPYDISSLGGALESYLISSPERTPDTVRKRIARIYSPEACAIRMCRSIERVLHLENGSLSGEFSSAAAVEPRPTMRAALP
jgi:glycosyltransferase involved in cell wall biosynthesis